MFEVTYFLFLIAVNIVPLILVTWIGEWSSLEMNFTFLLLTEEKNFTNLKV